jgi:HAD superfamily hydrolase (TIGR01484 family)
MEPLSGLPGALGRAIRFVLTDVDDTLTANGRLAAATYDALDRLQRASIKVIPVTAAPAGWCDGMARMWPVDAVIAENGGLSFVRDGLGVRRRYFQDEAERRAGQLRLLALGERIAASVPGAALAPDQPYREATLAISFADEGQRRDGGALALAMMKAAGARATVNSLWVLGWFGAFDKLEMTRALLPEEFGIELEAAREQVFYVGDSINDEPMFGFFPHAAGVTTISDYAARMTSLPRWIAAGGGGAGFVEVADALLAGR